MSEPLFILAPPRSFTSVVCAMIGNHPQMLGLPETNLFAADSLAELSRYYKVRPRFQHGLLRAVAELGLGGQTEEDVAAARLWLEEHIDMPTADVYRDLMTWAEPRALIDKSPMYVYKRESLARILESFPDARFLHLTRDPRYTCESILETRQMQHAATGQGFGEDDPEEGSVSPEKMWLDPHLNILELLETVPMDNKMFLRGEDIMSNPRLYLPQIAEWLRIDTSDVAVRKMLKPEESPFACMGPESARLGNDPRFLQNPKLREYKPKPVDLDSPMSWDDSIYFDEVIQHYAMLFGY